MPASPKRKRVSIKHEDPEDEQPFKLERTPSPEPVASTRSPRKKSKAAKEEEDDYVPQEEPSTPARGRGGQASPRTPTTPKVQLPPVTDPSTWRKSKIGPGKQLIKTVAERLYRLKPHDFAGLPYEEDRSPDGWPMYKYKERDVERRAWEIHGSPEGFDVYLAKLEQTYAKKSPGKTFPRPSEPAAAKKERVWRALPQTFVELHGSDWVYRKCGNARASWLPFRPKQGLEATTTLRTSER
jgi:hypothetical protein